MPKTVNAFLIVFFNILAFVSTLIKPSSSKSSKPAVTKNELFFMVCTSAISDVAIEFTKPTIV